MDLFVVNRYRDFYDNLDVIEQESKHLEKLKKTIEERKKALGNVSVSEKEPKEKVIRLHDFQNDKVEKEISESVEKIDTQDETKQITQKIVKQKPSHEFKVLGVSDFEKKTKVKRVLPFWLSRPFTVPTSLKDSSCQVKKVKWLNDTLKSTLQNEGVTYLFPVQEKVIPFILTEHKLPYPFWPHDVCVSVPTGSGKTLAFVLPIIQLLMNEIGHHVRALVVLPVQELATQVAKVFKRYCTKTKVKVALLSGSTPLQQEQQQLVRHTESSGWVSEADIIVCTAGRLVDHLQNTEGFSLKHLKFLVIDEADRIMDNIQNDWLYHLDKHIKSQHGIPANKGSGLNWKNFEGHKYSPHKLLFSATLSQDPEKLEQWGLYQPKLFSATPLTDFEDEDNIRKYKTPDELNEQFVTCNPESKPLVLYHFLVEQKWDKVLCFTNAAQTAHRLAILLNCWGKGKLKVAELSAALDRSTRENVLKKFTQSEINVLIGTDALARGIDIPDCSYVISYDPPRNIKTYIHRVGRTGRAGRTGYAVTILLPNQTSIFKELIKSSGKDEVSQIEIHSDVYDRLSEGFEWALHEAKNQIHTETDYKVKKSIEVKRGSKSKPQKRKIDGTVSKGTV